MGVGPVVAHRPGGRGDPEPGQQPLPFVLADGDWLFSSVVINPLVALLAAGIGALISTRVSSYRVAYQLNGLISLPVILVIIPQAAFLFLLTPRAFLYVAGLLAVLDVLVIAWALTIFDRDRLLRSS